MNKAFPYRLDTDEVLAVVGSSPQGLSSSEAKLRLEKDGPNELQRYRKVSALGIFFSQFKSFIIYILLFATAFSILIGEWIDSLIILTIILLNAVIGFFQEYSANRSLEALKQLTTVKARVLREGHLIEVSSRELVAGDVIRLRVGDKVPADARILEAKRLLVEESALTGESIPVEKDTGTLGGDLILAERSNMLFTSTAVVGGRATAVVTAIGMETELGKVARLVEEAEEPMTPLQKRLDTFGHRLGLVVIGICLFVFVASMAKESMVGELSLSVLVQFAFIAISLAVAAVPTALPAVVTIALSIGMKRLLNKNALVRRLASIETLGSCSVICTDKTGTLTRNQMTVRRAWTLAGEAELTGAGYSPVGALSRPLELMLFRIGATCNDAELIREGDYWRIVGDPTEGALIVSAQKTGVKVEGEREDEFPFDSYRKRMGVVMREQEGRRLYVKGAASHVLEVCTHALVDGQVVLLDEDMRKQIEDYEHQYASEALRVLAFAYRELGDKDPAQETDLIFVGLQGMIDPPRPGVRASLNKCQRAGIRVVMITGDHSETSRAVAEELGISGPVLRGVELDSMDDAALTTTLEKGVAVFCRVVPEHKQRIITSLQALGYAVAMTGDGINDAPALKKADIGVVMGSGTEVAKEAADIVLLDDGFTHIVNAIEEGRGIYDNIQKSIMLLLSGNLSEVLIVFLAVIFGLNLPLTAVLLLWINMITDGAPALAYSVDPYGKDIMERRPKPLDEKILPIPHMALIGVLGIFGTIIALGLFAGFGGASENINDLHLAQTMVFNFVVLYEMILVFVIRAGYRVSLLRNRWVWASVLLSLGLQSLLMYTPAYQLFKIVPLAPAELGVLALAGGVFFISFLVYHSLVQRLIFPGGLTHNSGPWS